MTHSHNNKEGFTLIELLVVVAIIGLLASVVIASLSSARSKGRDARRVADLKQIQTAEEMYQDQYGNYSLPSGGGAGSLTTTFIASVPTDPRNSAVYPYAAIGSGTTCSSYHLGAIMETTGTTLTNSDYDVPNGTVCTSGGTDFHGNATNCSGNTSVSPDMCYDVKA